MRHIAGFVALVLVSGSVVWQLVSFEPKLSRPDVVAELILQINEEERVARLQTRAEIIFDQGFEIKP